MPTTSANQSTTTSDHVGPCPAARVVSSASEAVNPGSGSGSSAGNPSDGTVIIDGEVITISQAGYTCLDCGAHFCRNFSDPNPQPHVCGVLEHCKADAYRAAEKQLGELRKLGVRAREYDLGSPYAHSKWWAR